MLAKLNEPNLCAGTSELLMVYIESCIADYVDFSFQLPSAEVEAIKRSSLAYLVKNTNLLEKSR